MWQVRQATSQEKIDLVEAIREHLPGKTTEQLRNIVKRGLMKVRKVVIIPKRARIRYRRPIGDPNGQTQERKKELNEIYNP